MTCLQHCYVRVLFPTRVKTKAIFLSRPAPVRVIYITLKYLSIKAINSVVFGILILALQEVVRVTLVATRCFEHGRVGTQLTLVVREAHFFCGGNIFIHFWRLFIARNVFVKILSTIIQTRVTLKNMIIDFLVIRLRALPTQITCALLLHLLKLPLGQICIHKMIPIIGNSVLATTHAGSTTISLILAHLVWRAL